MTLSKLKDSFINASAHLSRICAHMYMDMHTLCKSHCQMQYMVYVEVLGNRQLICESYETVVIPGYVQCIELVEVIMQRLYDDLLVHRNIETSQSEHEGMLPCFGLSTLIIPSLRI